tara:strand:+ start:173 stop:529 length:357 start_codon:yes stop_codon:yes gene_type:complete
MESSKETLGDKSLALDNEANILNVMKKLEEDKYIFSRNKPPPGFTIDMLKIALDCQDLRSQPDIGIEALWDAFYVNNFKKSKFGFYYDDLNLDGDKNITILERSEDIPPNKDYVNPFV